jgi:hypothetical protein
VVAKFDPFVGMLLHIGPIAFTFVPHPLFPDDRDAVYVIEGGEALIYQIRNMATHDLYALKVIKPVYRGNRIARAAEVLLHHDDMPALSVKQRICLTTTNFPDVIDAFPELEYATLMPWLEGKTWAGLMIDQTASAQYTLQQACRLAATIANLLWRLECRRLAHTDVAGGNILLSPHLRQVYLLDLEGIYSEGVPAPKLYSRGSPGYQHCHLGPHGQWCLEGDRFAGAVLLTEVLTWWNPRLRARVADDAESLFRPEELQKMDTPCWHEVRNILWSIHPPLLYLFDQAWTSSKLSECPEFSVWSDALSAFFV